MSDTKTAVVDLDNTLAEYDKWRGEFHIGAPIPWAYEALSELKEWGWQIIVFTTRGDDRRVADWLVENGFIHLIDWINTTDHNPPNTSHKPIAEVYFDDRDAHCVGERPYNWRKVMKRIRRIYQPRPLTTHIDDAAWWGRKPKHKRMDHSK